MINLLDDRFQLQDEIARGAIGVVWAATDAATGGRVAVKTLRPEAAGEPDLVAGLRAEAALLAGFDHPGVARLLATTVARGAPALVLELAGGGDLRCLLRSAGTLAPGVVAGIGVQVAEALAHVHAAGVVHCDVKPANLLVATEAPGRGGHGAPPVPEVRLADFGVARRVTDRAGTIHATPEYVAPEVAAGAVPGSAADVYALGIVLYELACGRTPFRGGEPVIVLGRHALGCAVAPDGMPAALWSVIEECLGKDPAARPAAAAVAGRLRAEAPELAGLPALRPLAADAVTWHPLASARTVALPAPADLAWVPPVPGGAAAEGGAGVPGERASAQRLVGLPLRRGVAGQGAGGARPPRRGLVGAVAGAVLLLGGGAAALAVALQPGDAVGHLVVVNGQVDASQPGEAGPAATTPPAPGPARSGDAVPPGVPFGSGLPGIGDPMPTVPGPIR